MEEGTGIVHIAPGCGAEDFELAREHDLPVLMPVDEAGRFYDSYGWLHGTSTAEAKDQIIGDLGERGRLLEAGEIVHRYPVCWRCHTTAHLPHRRRVVHRLRRDSPADAGRERDGEVDARLLLEAHGRLASQHGRLEHLAQAVLRPAASPLSVRVRPPQRDRLARRARGACDRRARPAAGAAPPVDRRGADPLRRVRGGGAAHSRGRRRLARRRHRPLLDARLENPSERTGTQRLLAGPLGRRPTGPRLLGDWFPRTGCRRCASRFASGSTRSSSCRSRSWARRRTRRSSPTRSSATRPARRCTSPGGTRSRRTRPWTRWART